MTNSKNKNKIQFKKLSNSVKVALLAGTMAISMGGCSSCGANHIDDPVEIVVETQEPVVTPEPEVVEPIVTPEPTPEVVEPVVTPEPTPEIVEDEITYEELIEFSKDLNQYLLENDNYKFITEFYKEDYDIEINLIALLVISNLKSLSSDTINQLISDQYLTNNWEENWNEYSYAITAIANSNSIRYGSDGEILDSLIDINRIFINSSDNDYAVQYSSMIEENINNNDFEESYNISDDAIGTEFVLYHYKSLFFNLYKFENGYSENNIAPEIASESREFGINYLNENFPLEEKSFTK